MKKVSVLVGDYRGVDSHLAEEVESSFLIANALQRPVFELHRRFAVMCGDVFVYNEHQYIYTVSVLSGFFAMVTL